MGPPPLPVLVPVTGDHCGTPGTKPKIKSLSGFVTSWPFLASSDPQG